MQFRLRRMSIIAPRGPLIPRLATQTPTEVFIVVSFELSRVMLKFRFFACENSGSYPINTGPFALGL